MVVYTIQLIQEVQVVLVVEGPGEIIVIMEVMRHFLQDQVVEVKAITKQAEEVMVLEVSL